MVSRLQRALRIRPGEGGVVARVLALMVVLFVGLSIGGAAVEGLYLSRSGPRGLPLLYIALGPLTLVAMVGMGAALGGRDPRRLLVLVHAGTAVLIAAAWALLFADPPWIYPALWLLMMVLWTVAVFSAWGLAGYAHDTRQAKRLFPLYGAGLILGSVAGGAATAPLATLLGADNLLLVWAALAGAATLIAAPLARGPAPRRPLEGGGTRLGEGFRAVRRSRLLSAMALALALFALLYFALSFVFATVVARRFPAADDLAGFLGGFTAAVNGVALLVSLVLAGRLFARFGIVAMVLVLPVLYLVGFVGVAIMPTFGVVVGLRFAQMVWVNGVWATGWQALFNVVPSERRAQVRTFMDGVPLQAGVVGAGLLLLAADRYLGDRAVAVVGAVAALLAVAATVRARRAYVDAVVASLREGNPEVFVREEAPFAGFAGERQAVSAVLEGAADADPVVRRISLRLLAEVGVAEGAPAVEAALGDADPGVRAAALGAAAALGHPSLAGAVAPLVADPAAEVRAAVPAALLATTRDPRSVGEPLLGDDDPEVRAAAAGALLGPDEGARRLEGMLGEGDPSERAAAAAALGAMAGEPGLPEHAIEALVDALRDTDPSVRLRALEVVPELGPAAMEPLSRRLEDGDATDEVLEALMEVGPADHASLRAYARAHAAEAERYGRLWRAVDRMADPRAELIVHALRHRTELEALRALRALVGTEKGHGLRAVLDNLASPYPEQRANALEVLESSRDAAVVRPLLAVWDEAGPGRADVAAILGELLDDPDPWLRACAALAAAGVRSSLEDRLRRVVAADPDPLVRETARLSVEGGGMETLETVPLLERMMFLRKVPLFEHLSPEDLKQVAEVASEQLFADGTVVAEQGESGDDLFVVVAGEIEVERDGEAVARRGPGQYVGEMAVITGSPRMASLRCRGEVRALAVDRRRFERILRERPDASLAVMRTLCERLEESYAGA